jgi:hypothetical protein
MASSMEMRCRIQPGSEPRYIFQSIAGNMEV